MNEQPIEPRNIAAAIAEQQAAEYGYDQERARNWWGCGCTRCVRAWTAPPSKPCAATTARVRRGADEALLRFRARRGVRQ